MIDLLPFLFVAGAAVMDVGMVTQGPPDVALPHETTGNTPACYGMGFPLQLSPTEAALFCNLRAIAPGMFDYEDGTDVLIFDNMNGLRDAEPVPVSRNQIQADAETGKTRIVVKFPLAGGIWPLGAMAVDGSRHPGEGRGFGFCQALSFEMGEEGSHVFKWTEPFVRYVEMLQFRYDGEQFTVSNRELVGPTPLPPAGPDGWQLMDPGLTNAIPDGDDLLQPVFAVGNGQLRSGVCRWVWQEGRWTAASFAPVCPGCEPSLVRLADGSLMFAARLTGEYESTVAVYRSEDAGNTWSEVVRQDDVRSPSPVSIGRTTCGTPFVASNPHGAERARLCLWTVDGADLTGPRVIRDATDEFGQLPEEMFWCVDHPSSATVRLADGQWHALLTYRVKAFYLPTRMRPEPVMPQSGCYVEEVSSAGPAVPEWQF